MKILIVSGFLGAGKTTFIKSLVRHTGKDFAILENEYSVVGIDGDNLRSSLSAGKVNIWELAEGCICCSMKGDFAASVLTIANSVDPEYLIVEPTGVGVLSSIISNLRQIEYERISLLSPITIVDFHSYERYRQEFPDLYQDQIRSAHTVIVSKTEQAGTGEKNALKEHLKKWNPDGDIITEHYSTLDKKWYMELLERGFDGTVFKSSQNESQVLPDTFSIDHISLDSPEKLFLLMEQIVNGLFGNILRAKGHLKAGNQMFQFDLSDGRYALTGMENEEKGKAVFIGMNIKRQRLRRYFYQTNIQIEQSSSAM